MRHTLSIINRLIIILCLLMFLGCTTTSTVTFSDGKVFLVKAKSDEFITVTRDGATYVFDRRGRPSLFEAIITMMFMDTSLKNKAKEE